MEENAARLQQAMEAKFAAGGLNPQDFREVARTFVYGGLQSGINQKQNESQRQHKDLQDDPAYQPDDEELGNEDDEFDADEEERNVSKRPSQVEHVY